MTRHPGVVQESFEGMPSQEVDRGFGVQRNFAGYVTPEMWGLEASNYQDITPRMIELVVPDRLRESLIDVSPGSQGAVSFRSADRRQPLWVALNPVEYGHISRSVEALGGSAVNQTLARSGAVHLPQHQPKATRSAIHVVERKQQKMEEYLNATLLSEAARLERFIEYSTHPQFRRKKGIDMHIELGWIQDNLFDNMLSVIGRQRNWTNMQEDMAKRSLQWRLFFDRDSNQHISNWQDTLKLALDYQQAKTALYKDRIYQSKKYVKKHAE